MKDELGNARLVVRTVLLILLGMAAVQAEPKIRQEFPTKKVLLGESLYWIIELRYPLWEAYDLKLNPSSGIEMEIAEEAFQEDRGEMSAGYRIKLVPQSLVITEAPTATISDEKGQTAVITGKAILVQSISGDSLDIKPPDAPKFMRPSSKWRSFAISILLIVFAAFLIFVSWLFYRSRTPRSLLLRDLTKALVDAKKGHLAKPSFLLKLLRSDLLWGFPAQAYTSSELHAMGQSDRRLDRIGKTLKSLELARYSETAAPLLKAALEQSLSAAIEIAAERRHKEKQ